MVAKQQQNGEKMKKINKENIPGICVGGVFCAILVAFFVLLVWLKMIPNKYLVIIGIAECLLGAGMCFFLRNYKKNKISFIIACILALIISILLAFGSHALYQGISTVRKLSNTNAQFTEVGLYVEKDSAIQSIAEIDGCTIGILELIDRDNTDKVLELLKTEDQLTNEVVEYISLAALFDGLLNGECDVIVFNGAFLDIVEELEGYENIHEKIREIERKKVVLEFERPTKKPAVQESTTGATEDSTEKKPEAVTRPQIAKNKDVINVYISGSDTRGGLYTTGRSDSNIILSLNTKTNQALLLSTPRDYYVPLSISYGIPDKLTHAGIYGIDCSMDTLEMLYGIDFDYYFRVNFYGFIDIIDALGGISVYNSVAFESSSTGKYYNVGMVEMNGTEALTFARERYAFADGDRQRGRNQMAVIKGVINKMLSPELLKNYSSLLSSLNGCFDMNVPYDTIAKLVREQLADGGSWNIVTYSVDGWGDSRIPFSMSQYAYVMIPDESTVNHAIELLNDVNDGKVIKE